MRSSDGELFELDESAAAMSQTIKYVIEDGCADTAIPLANVDGKILAKVVHYCTKHVEMERTLLADLDGKLVAPNVKRWDAEFMKEVDMNTLYELLLVSSSFLSEPVYVWMFYDIALYIWFEISTQR